MRRRTLLATVGSASVAALAGCSGATTFRAKPAGVEQSAVNETGYEKKGTNDRTISRTFAGQKVKVVNKVTTYEKTIDTILGSVRAGVFATVSTPAVELAGQTFNPVESYGTKKLVGLLASQYESIQNPTKAGETEVTILGSSHTVARYEATATFQGQELDVYIHVAPAIEDGSDFVVPIGVYPKQNAEQERPNTMTLLKNVVHPLGSN
ncbi:DUF6517 family protein [Halobaculum sp. D14]|uniref:DUF6517 family protein n=1 Tax=unclassified Halobaculum TaxID=2640896 RepID=UPI003EC097F6